MLSAVNETLVSRHLKARQLASVTELIISNLIVFGNTCKLMTKTLHRKIDSRVNWESNLILDSESIDELNFCLEAVPELNCRSINI